MVVVVPLTVKMAPPTVTAELRRNVLLLILQVLVPSERMAPPPSAELPTNVHPEAVVALLTAL